MEHVNRIVRLDPAINSGDCGEHPFTRRNHPQTNGTTERMNKTVKDEAIRVGRPVSYQDAIEVLPAYEYVYNYQRLHAGIRFLRPADMFFNRGAQVFEAQNEKFFCMHN